MPDNSEGSDGGAPGAVLPPESIHPRFEVPGGWIVVRPNNLDAHCNNPDHNDPANPCRVTKGTNPKDMFGNNGRPAALLMAWLANSSKFEDRHSHGRSIFKSSRTPADKIALGQTARNEWRKWLIGQLYLAPVLQEERRKRSDEEDEPPNL